MTVKAPWTQDQVAALELYQQHPRFHPYTCPYTHDWRNRRLVPTVDGWVCGHPHCDYTQDWAHSMAFEIWAQ